MKKIIFLSLTGLCLSVKIYGQQTSPELYPGAENYRIASYLSIHKTLKTAGWTSLATGIPLFCLGIAFEAGSIENLDKGGARTARWMVPSGAALTFASIPCFILSGRYKRKAIALSLNNQSVIIPLKNSFSSRIQPAFSLKIPL